MNEVNVQAYSGTMPIFPTLIYKDLPRPDNYHPIQKEVKAALLRIEETMDYGEVSYIPVSYTHLTLPTKRIV